MPGPSSTWNTSAKRQSAHDGDAGSEFHVEHEREATVRSWQCCLFEFHVEHRAQPRALHGFDIGCELRAGIRRSPLLFVAATPDAASSWNATAALRSSSQRHLMPPPRGTRRRNRMRFVTAVQGPGSMRNATAKPGAPGRRHFRAALHLERSGTNRPVHGSATCPTFHVEPVRVTPGCWCQGTCSAFHVESARMTPWCRCRGTCSAFHVEPVRATPGAGAGAPAPRSMWNH
jgi:hypothetical protein